MFINIFSTTPKAPSNSSETFSEKIIQYSMNFCITSPNVMEPSQCTPPFQRWQKHDLKLPSFVGSHNWVTKQNKLPSSVDRSSILGEPPQFQSFFFFCNGPIKITHYKKKVGLVKHRQLININHTSLSPTENIKLAKGLKWSQYQQYCCIFPHHLPFAL